MNTKLSVFPIFVAFTFCLCAQTASTFPSSVSIANASVANPTEWNAFQNTSALANIENGEVAMIYENRYMVKELSTKTVQTAFDTKHVAVGAAFSYFGYELYNDFIVGAGLARNFDNKFSIGVQFNYYAAYFSGEATNYYRGTIFPQIGVSSQILSKFTIGFNAFNPFQSNINTEYIIKRIPSIFSLGTNYSFSENFIWLTQIDKEVSSNFRFASGFEYVMVDALTVKLGAYAYDRLIPAMGANVHINQFHIYLNTELHPNLGLNTQVCLKYKY
ncbi:MAG: hypothetical protein ACK5L7_02055 [Paludibacteraceae bacterium]